jgi:serine/threonine-protein kinase HipA
LENLFRLVLFNYLLSNGDAHLKNFSLIQTDAGDYGLAPAYDLMSTIIHMPAETDAALDLYQGDHSSPFYSKYGYPGQPEFRVLADKFGLVPKRAERILSYMLTWGHKCSA